MNFYLQPINVKTAEPIGYKYFRGPHMSLGPLEKFMDAQNYKKMVYTTFFGFSKILKIQEIKL